MKLRLVFLILALGLLLGACGSEADLDSPPELVLGQDVCDECSMIINDARFAASYVTVTGEVRRFDDIGDMLVYMQKHAENVHRYWVHDMHSEEWIDTSEATFVMSPDLHTPMAWGLAAFAEHADAEAFAGENGGATTTFASLLEDMAAGELTRDSVGGQMQDGNGMEMDMNDGG